LTYIQIAFLIKCLKNKKTWIFGISLALIIFSGILTFRPVVMIEANWESLERNKINGRKAPDSDGELLFISPGFFFAY